LSSVIAKNATEAVLFRGTNYWRRIVRPHREQAVLAAVKLGAMFFIAPHEHFTDSQPPPFRV
jgi:hypothetical protein